MGLEQQLDLACWIARHFFDRGMGSGTTGNLSLAYEGRIYITGGGTCFGNLTPDQFSVVDPQTLDYTGCKPSKELPLHLTAYRKSPDVGAVIHIHSTYATLWSCLPHPNDTDCVPQYTPYLRMRLGTVGLVPYAPPGSQALFDQFAERMPLSDGWLLANHGLVVPGRDLMAAFAAAEELEESCKLAWMLRGTEANRI